MKALKINSSMEEIKAMPIFTFKKLLKQKCEEKALEYLLNKQGSKGSQIIYSKMKMADYLYPNDQLSITEQRRIFSIRNKMVADIPANFCSKEKNTNICICKMKEDIEHIYNCKILNKIEPKVKYEMIYSENINQQKLIMKRLENNMKTRNEQKNLNEPCDPLDPLYSHVENSNG